MVTGPEEESLMSFKAAGAVAGDVTALDIAKEGTNAVACKAPEVTVS